MEHAPHRRHPLQYEWTFWFHSRQFGDDYEETLKSGGDFATVEDFWSIFNHVKKPSDLDKGSNYYIFKKGIRPVWEDDVNRKGGRWLILFPESYHRLDEAWEELVLAVIGNTMKFVEDVNGIQFSFRPRGSKIQLWTRSLEPEEHAIEIGLAMERLMGLQDGHQGNPLRFGSLEESVAQEKSYLATDIYTILGTEVTRKRS
eukprot:TRINITY_DN82219_c0_g1_i1.p1 TRINITY_DN82219_c0_g1~~TRINITY_DN82219_c0_g1_i1.p1  ORF type:complete len:201 (-),score=56.80 TRINITY_DN82219_c0_g1_i1:141-743(-)